MGLITQGMHELDVCWCYILTNHWSNIILFALAAVYIMNASTVIKLSYKFIHTAFFLPNSEKDGTLSEILRNTDQSSFLCNGLFDLCSGAGRC